MNIKISLADLDEDQLGSLILRKAQELGMIIAAPERQEPYTAAEAAEALNVSLATIYDQIKTGQLPIIPRLSIKRIPAWVIRTRQAGGDVQAELRRRKL